MSITNEVFLSYLDCHYKAHLAANGTGKESHEYLVLQHDLEQQHSSVARAVLLNQSKLESAPSGGSVELLAEQHPLLFDVELHAEGCTFRFDALERKSGNSRLGDFLYAPVLFHHGKKVLHHQRLLLGFGAHVLGQMQGELPQTGSIVLGQATPVASVRLGSSQSKVQAILADLQAIVSGQKQPPLRLNRHCAVCQFRSRCRAEATDKDDLSLLGGISESQIADNHAKGIFTLHQLSFTFRPRRRPKHLRDKPLPFQPALQAQAIRDSKTYIVARPSVPTATTHVYVDMEGLEYGQFVYLIGALAVTGEEETFESFWTDTQDGETEIFQSFSRWLASLGDVQVFHYGSYESTVFKRLADTAPSKQAAALTTEHGCNVLSLIYRRVYFPVYSNSLKEIGGLVGAKWRGEKPDGIQAVVWRTRWEQSHNPSLKQLLLDYNEDDCRALRAVTEHLAVISEGNNGDHPAAIDADELLHQEDYGRWGRRSFAIDDFRLMAACAYFDYQRSKVYVRTSPAVKTATKKRNRQRTKKNRPNVTINIKAYKCRWCKSKDLVRSEARYHEKFQLDLRITKSGIRRWVTRFRTPYMFCKQCRSHPMPASYKAKNRYGHNLLVWATYQQVVNRMSLSQVELALKECFNISLPYASIHQLRGLAACYYRKSYRAILRRLVAGKLLHVDETKAKLKNQSGYVWVFTNMDSVYYTYRPSREGVFLHELLAGFDGVLVTDFYSVYDSLPCPQQKCLVHLMWDINADLLKNPFDEELKSIATSFGRLLQSIIHTVDRFGLKSRHLRKHQREVQKFLAAVLQGNYASEAAQRYQERFQKYSGKLFVFLDHDGVPWNNNNAEHAIKPYAKYRRLMRHSMQKNGLKDYLVLLSIWQTCEYRGVSFFEFLVSQHRDLDAFCTETH